MAPEVKQGREARRRQGLQTDASPCQPERRICLPAATNASPCRCSSWQGDAQHHALATARGCVCAHSLAGSRVRRIPLPARESGASPCRLESQAHPLARRPARESLSSTVASRVEHGCDPCLGTDALASLSLMHPPAGSGVSILDCHELDAGEHSCLETDAPDHPSSGVSRLPLPIRYAPCSTTCTGPRHRRAWTLLPGNRRA
jgi:hypothetical protein